MNEAIMIELRFFLISILWGVILLLVYDGLRIFRRIIKQNSFAIAMQDLLFWVVSSVFIFSMMYRKNNGIIRGFSIMGMILGMLVYHNILSDPVVNIVTKVLLTLFRPAVFAIRQIKKMLNFVGKTGKKATSSILLRLKKQVKSVKIAVDKKKQARLVRKKELELEKKKIVKRKEQVKAQKQVKLEKQVKLGEQVNRKEQVKFEEQVKPPKQVTLEKLVKPDKQGR